MAKISSKKLAVPTTILAIESSCDETAVAVLRHDGELVTILSVSYTHLTLPTKV